MVNEVQVYTSIYMFLLQYPILSYNYYTWILKCIVSITVIAVHFGLKMSIQQLTNIENGFGSYKMYLEIDNR